MRYYLAATFLSQYENQTWPSHFAREGIESVVFIFRSLWTQQDGVPKFNIPSFDSLHRLFSGISAGKWDMFF